MDPDKMKFIAEWPVPKTKKQMGSFLGTTVYVSRFCKDFAQFAGPLHDSIKGKRPRDAIKLSDGQLRGFNELKNRLTSPPVLSLSDFSKSFGIRMDASNFAIGGVWFQKEGELEHPIAFNDRKMKPAELNSPVREQELLAIMHALRRKTAQVCLQELLDATRNRVIVATIRTNKVTVAQTAKTVYSWNKDLQWIIRKLKQGEDVPKYSLQDGILYYQTGEDETPRLYIPDDEDLKNRVICENHDAVSAGHPGFYKTYLAEREKYLWPKMMKYIQRYVYTCEMCQRNKARQNKPPGLLQPLDIPKGRWTDISMDFVVSLPVSTNGNNVIMVIVDRLTKRAKFIAMKTIDTTTDIADVFMKNYVKDHGLPKTIVSDQDTKFTSRLWQRIVKALGPQHNLSSAFRPQTDGQTERTNRFIGDYLRGVINPAQNDWNDYLHLAEFAYIRRVHSTMECHFLKRILDMCLTCQTMWHRIQNLQSWRSQRVSSCFVKKLGSRSRKTV
ncbi:unnamed protein product [Phytophthora fragariaefolia]|uniref:Unnamed protein product n=1 Tax=Phytophthora fragariaefolia TaxID=1490495 RepID=A0A9W6Y449_9STRA|nr:unnamed protein product [Phytophthora fragariaefolia]